MSITWKIVARSVVSKQLLNLVETSINEVFSDSNIIWDSEMYRDSVVMVLFDWLDQLKNEGKITHFKVWCDLRNNVTKNIMNGIYHLDLHYKQMNCYNYTTLLCTITTNKKNV